jgi:rifampicin phosphotransferase
MPAFRTDWDTEPNPTYDVWTTTNGGEVVPGILTPFSATSFNRADYLGMKDLMGAYPTGKHVKVYKAPVGNFFGIIAGRLALNAGFTAAAMSVLDPQIAEAMLQQFFTGAGQTEKFVVRVSDELRAGAVAVAAQQRADAPAYLDSRKQALYAERASDQFAQDRALGMKAAWRRLQQLEDDNIRALNLHYVVSTAAGEFQVKLMGVLAMSGLDPAAAIGLCSGLGDVESSKPAKGLWDLGQVALKNPSVAQSIRTLTAEEVVAAVTAPKDSGWKKFATAFQKFLFDYGFRVQGEADPTNADWTEQPAFAISQVRTMMDVPVSDSPHEQAKRSANGRKALEKQIRTAIPKELKPAYDAMLAEAQKFTRMREYSKAMWILGVRRARAPYLALADGLVASQSLKVADDIRFCVYDEVKAMAAGKVVADLSAHIKRRKAQYKAAHDYVLPDVWFGSTTPKKRAKISTATDLTGLGVSAGAGPVEGIARIVPDVQATMERDIEVGEILVAPFTDAPWTPLFIPAGGVVVETGGVLSHAATVAREFGIPCVVMVHDATRIIRDGDRVRVDGAAGTVTILERAK